MHPLKVNDTVIVCIYSLLMLLEFYAKRRRYMTLILNPQHEKCRAVHSLVCISLTRLMNIKTPRHDVLSLSGYIWFDAVIVL